MQVKLYACTDLPNVVQKSFTLIDTITTVKPYEPLDNLSGYLILDYTNTKFNYVLFNDKYYYVTSIETLNGRNMKVNLREDTLSTYSNLIMGFTDVSPDRGGTQFNSFIYDTQQKSQVDYDVFSIPFDSIPFGRTIVACIGAKSDR